MAWISHKVLEDVVMVSFTRTQNLQSMNCQTSFVCSSFGISHKWEGCLVSEAELTCWAAEFQICFTPGFWGKGSSLVFFHAPELEEEMNRQKAWCSYLSRLNTMVQRRDSFASASAAGEKCSSQTMIYLKYLYLSTWESNQIRYCVLIFFSSETLWVIFKHCHWLS